MGVGQPVDGGLEQPVVLDVLGIFVVGHFDGQREPVTTPDLVGEPDLAPHGVEGFFLPSVPRSKPRWMARWVRREKARATASRTSASGAKSMASFRQCLGSRA